MRSREFFAYLIAHPKFFDSLDSYAPRIDDYFQRVSGCIPEDWHIRREGAWWYCQPPTAVLPSQGWKIHVSSLVETAGDLLIRVARHLSEVATPFKFALDATVLRLMNGKNWGRGSSGKFITVYPRDDEQFSTLLVALDRVTRGFKGPYILSDRRFGSSGVVFYRYGGMVPRRRVTVEGDHIPVILAPDGSVVDDIRRPKFHVPSWVTLPAIITRPSTEQLPGKSRERKTLGDGRFAIQEVLSFSNAGGVYKAVDRQSGSMVVIKEARPFIETTDDGTNAQSRLRREYSVLERLIDTGAAPRPVALLEEWEHLFLVEEFIDGTPFLDTIAQRNVFLSTRRDLGDLVQYRTLLASILASVTDALSALHERGIVFGDVSTRNVIVRPDHTVAFIDFETAIELGTSDKAAVFTPGFAAPEQTGGDASVASDVYGVGALALAGLFPLNNLFQLDRRALRRVGLALCRDANLPRSGVRAVARALSPNPQDRCSLHDLRAAFHELGGEGKCLVTGRGHPHARRRRSCADLYEQTIRAIERNATPGRADRLWPCDSSGFRTNQLCLAWGAAGILSVMHAAGVVHDGWKDWFLARCDAEDLPPGLFVGRAGIALALSELGYLDEATRLALAASTDERLIGCADLFQGAAGVGVAALRLWSETSEDVLLDRATHLADVLLARAVRTPEGATFWPFRDATSLGLCYGSSGIGLFLTELYRITNQARYKEAAEAALLHDLLQAKETRDGGWSWTYRKDTPSALLPYWQYGSAGIGAAVCRYLPYGNIGAFRCAEVLKRILLDTARKYTVQCGQLMGLAGIGQFLMDAFEATGDREFLQALETLLDGLALFALRSDDQVCWPGSLLLRLSCDFGTGSAGVASLLGRVVGRGQHTFMPAVPTPIGSEVLA